MNTTPIIDGSFPSSSPKSPYPDTDFNKSALLTDSHAKAILPLIHAKEKNIREMTSFSYRIKSCDEWILCGGDFFTMGYLFFATLVELTPSLTKDPSIQAISSGFGIIGGIINILVGVVCFKNACIELKAGRKKIAARLFLDAFSLTGIGLIMTLISLSSYTTFFAGATTIFIANPWLLPTLFFLMNIPILLEVLERSVLITIQKDPATLYLESKKPFFNASSSLISQEEFQPLLQKYHDLLEKLQGEMGPEAALAFFEMTLEKELGNSIEIDSLKSTFDQKNREWKKAQFVRLFQMLCCLAAFSLTCMTGIRIDHLQALINLLEMLTNLIPLYMDLFWPLKRNTHLPIPGLLSNDPKIG